MSLHFDEGLTGEYLNYTITVKNSPQTGFIPDSLAKQGVVVQTIPVYDLVSSDEESTSSSTNLNECRQLSIKIVDCKKYPWYYKKYRISSTAYEPVSGEEDFVDDLIKIDFNMEQINSHSSSTCLKDDNSKVTSSIPQPEKKKEKKKHKIEAQSKIDQKNASKIDFQKNTGLVGLKITPLIDLRCHKEGSKKSTSANNNKVDKYILEVNSSLRNVGTVVMPVSNDENSKKENCESITDKKSEKIKAREVVPDTHKISKKKSKKSKTSEKNYENDRSKKSEKSEEDGSQKNEAIKPIPENVKDLSVTSHAVKQSDVKDKRKTNKYLNDLIKKKNEAMDIIKKLKKIRDACNTIKNNKSLPATSIIKNALGDDLNDNISKEKPILITLVDGPKSPVLPCNGNVTSKASSKMNTSDSEIKKHRDALIQMINSIGNDNSKNETKEITDTCSKDDVSEQKTKTDEPMTNTSIQKKTSEENSVITSSNTQANLSSDCATSIVVSTHQKLATDQSNHLDQSIATPYITCKIINNKNTPEKSKKEFAYVPPNQRIRQNITNNIPVVTSACTRNGPDVPIHQVVGKEVVWRKIPHYHSSSITNPNGFPYNLVSVESQYNPRYHYNVFKAMPPLTNMNRYNNNVYHPYWNQYLVAPPPPPPPPLPQQSPRNMSNEQQQTCKRVLKHNSTTPALIPNVNNTAGKDIQHSGCNDKTTNKIQEVKTNLAPVNTKSEMLKELERSIVDLNYNSCTDPSVHTDKIPATNNKLNVECRVAHETKSLSGNNSAVHSNGNTNNVPVKKNNVAHIIYKSSNSNKLNDGLVKDLSMKGGKKMNPKGYYTYNGSKHELDNYQSLNENVSGKLQSKIGYSPPILPIPTYQSTLDILSRANYESQKGRPLSMDTRKEYVRAKLVQVPVESNVSNLYHTKELDNSGKKISLQEYQKRLSQSYHNSSAQMHDSPRVKRAKTDSVRANLPNLVPIVFSHDQDLGYDSDVTIKI